MKPLLSASIALALALGTQASIASPLPDAAGESLFPERSELLDSDGPMLMVEADDSSWEGISESKTYIDFLLHRKDEDFGLRVAPTAHPSDSEASTESPASGGLVHFDLATGYQFTDGESNSGASGPAAGFSIVPIPEPSSLLLVLIGSLLLLLPMVGRPRKQQSS